jgi:hypothetical protein
LGYVDDFGAGVAAFSFSESGMAVEEERQAYITKRAAWVGQTGYFLGRKELTWGFSKTKCYTKCF